jgi:aryl-alcohol dehydrogenase-like predicted oxidoreductase
VEQRALGGTGLEVSAIGFGAWAIGGHGYGPVDEQTSIAVIREALDLGVTLFDTADVYGLGASERLLGRALGADRKRVIIASKFGVAWDPDGRTWKDASPRHAVTALEASLKRLDVDCIPLYQIHWPDPKTPLSDILDVLERCRDQGKIQYIGCSNFDAPQLTGSADRLSSIQYRFNLAEREREEDIRMCRRILGLGVIAYSVLARGLFSAKFREPVTFGPGDTRSSDPNFQGERLHRMLQLVANINEVAARYARTPAQVAIRWVLDHPDVSCALVGAKSVEQMVDNAGALGWQLAPEDWRSLAQAAARFELSEEM